VASGERALASTPDDAPPHPGASRRWSVGLPVVHVPLRGSRDTLQLDEAIEDRHRTAVGPLLGIGIFLAGRAWGLDD
jgi:hypothetical protein